jgi:hypothetical protein
MGVGIQRDFNIVEEVEKPLAGVKTFQFDFVFRIFGISLNLACIKGGRLVYGKAHNTAP